MEERTFAWLPLSPLLQDVVKHDSEKLGDGWLLKTSSVTGEFITSMVRFTREKPVKPEGDCMKVYIPVTRWTQDRLENYYAEFCAQDCARIAAMVDSQMRHRVMMWVESGRWNGYSLKQCLYGIIEEYGLRASEDSFEMLKKMAYRERVKVRRDMAARMRIIQQRESPQVKKRPRVVI